MAVVATAGHVDHGKSALVRALTGRDPDRYAEEKRRGMTLDLGFAWVTLPSGEPLAFVDVPGHERFVPTMLAGVGPVPAVMFVVAADEGWRQQSSEHLAAIDALGAGHGVLVVTKADLADPEPVRADCLRRLAGTSLHAVPSVGVSIHDSDSLDLLRQHLDELVASLPAPPPGPVRLWVDRSFTVRGAGTVVTGTLGRGEIATGDELAVVGDGSRRVAIRELQSMDRTIGTARPVSRVAANLRGIERSEVGRGAALVTPGAWTVTDLVDVRAREPAALPAIAMVHIGSAAVTGRIRPLADSFYRLRLATSLPLHVGDRLLLRDAARHVVLGAADILDVAPPALRGTGAVAARANALTGPLTADRAVQRCGAAAVDAIRSAGYDDPISALRLGEYWVSRDWLADRRRALVDVVTSHGELSLDEVRHRVDVPDRALLLGIVHGCADVVLRSGYLGPARVDVQDSDELRELLQRLSAAPFDAPEAAAIDVDPAELAAAVRHGRLLHLVGGIYVAPDAPDLAIAVLRDLPQPFTTSAARQALGITRRVAVPLLEHLDRSRRTRRVSDTHREVFGDVTGRRDARLARIDGEGVTAQEPHEGHPGLDSEVHG